MNPGKVFLVGAGPGDPGLLTLKGLRCIESADVIIFDRLVNKRLLGHAPPGAELVDVGKVPGGGEGAQENINSLLAEWAKKGKRVVRLKGGDPFVFGRGGEEAEFLQAEGIPFEVVPGVTSAIAAPAYAGIPLTHRGLASSFSVVTGSEASDQDASPVPWGLLVGKGRTLVVLMGWENLASIVRALLKEGKPPETHAALVRWGTEPCQQTVVGTLSDIVEKATLAGLSPPVVAVFGEVVRLRDRLRWFDNRPLFGKRVLVTRTRTQAGLLSEILSLRGASPVELPAIEVRPLEDYAKLDDALRQLSSYNWVIFTSVNAVHAVFQRLKTTGTDARAFGTSRIAAIGPATAASLAERSIVADFVPEAYLSEAVVRGFRLKGVAGSRVLLPRADIARDTLPQGLRGLGAVVEEVTVYRTVIAEESRRRVQEVLAEGLDIATFTSSSTVTNLASLLDGNLGCLGGVSIACIGPVTAATARELGLKVDIVARMHTIPGLVDALDTYFSQEGSSHEQLP